MKNYVLFPLLLLSTLLAQDLFFSEYIEGSSYNKALEIYNPTDATIDLSEYQLWQISNGGDWPEYTVDISGQLAPGDVFVVCHEDADPAMTAHADLLITLYHNGDDAQGLAKNDGSGNFILIDAIGESGDDPGSGWDVAGVTNGTKEHTLVRMPNVSQGNTDWDSSAGTTASNSEWLVYPQNTFDYLGSHDYGGTVLIVDAGDDQLVLPGELVSLDGSGSAGDIIAYIWTQISGTSVSISGSESAEATFTAPSEGGALEFELTVYDSEGNSATDVTSVNVIDQMSILSARNMGVGAAVMVQGVVISINFQEGNGNTEYVIQDDTAGLVVFGVGFDVDLSYGDLIQVSGLTDEFNGKFEVLVSSENDIAVMGQGALPEAQLVTVSDLSINGESYESELITIQSVTVIDGVWPSEGSSENLTIVDGGSGTATMRIDSDTEIDGTDEPSWPANVTGVAGQYDSSEPYTEGYQLLPCFTSDFVATGGNQLPIANAGEDQMVEHGAVVTLDGSGSSDPDGTISGFLWEQISGEAVTLSDYEEAIVTFTAPDVSTTMVFRLTVFDDQGAMDTDEVSILILMADQTIYDLQYTTEQGAYCYETPLAGQLVTTSGIVTHVNSASSPNFFLQDPNGATWSGIYVYDTSVSPSVGDELQITATVNEFYSFTQLIDVVSSTVVSSENTISPIPVSAIDIGIECSESGEMYESMLVSYSNVTFESVDEYGNWTISDGTGTAMVDDYYFDGNWPTISVGDYYDSITGVIGYSYSEFKLYPRNSGDMGGDTGPSEISIYDLQYTTEQGDYCYETPMAGQLVTTSGIVTHVKSADNPNFFLQDPSTETWSGIFVYDTLVVPSVGDELQITATVNEYYSFTQLISVSSTSLISSGNDLSPTSVTADEIGIECSESGEMYESMLVSYSNVTFESVDEYGNWTISDGTGTAMVDDYYFDGNWPTISVGDYYDSITGVIGYSYSEFKLYPRNENDFTTGSGESSINVDFQSGWNLVGVSMNVESFLYTDVFTESVNGTMYGFSNTYSSESVFSPGNGYWLYFDNTGSQVIAGQPIESVSVTLSEGWNLISGPSVSVNIGDVIDPDNIIVSGTLYGFESTYFSANDIEPGKGYWLNADSAGEITLTTENRSSEKISNSNYLSDASLLTMNGVPLYFGVEISQDKFDMFSLPPLPPINLSDGGADFFDVRFADDKKVLISDDKIMVTGTNSEIKLSWSINPNFGNDQWQLIDEFGKAISLSGSGEVVVSPVSSAYHLKKVNTIPNHITLDQNFPNPFNSTTTITFGVPVESYTSLHIFSLDGKKVFTLIDDFVNPGIHSIQWNGTDERGTNISSGVYMYHLSVGSYSELRKMVLIK